MVLSPPSTALGLNRFLPRLLTPASYAYVSGVRAVQPSSSASRRGLHSIGFHDAAPSASKTSFWRVISLVRLIMHICTYREVPVVL
jgi:hypothetical protein